ncbi:uncharacterized protein BJX67DRAFT_3414 [Aspergillus lucknowensis]|uniref:Uncharacterized protein n=1 Tax=Aspergillus lucknowensis TaxID=176173 RepID=A0ABR4M6Y3_9EURO
MNPGAFSSGTAPMWSAMQTRNIRNWPPTHLSCRPQKPWPCSPYSSGNIRTTLAIAVSITRLMHYEQDEGIANIERPRNGGKQSLHRKRSASA